MTFDPEEATNATMAEFLKTELDLAVSFIEGATTTSSPQKRLWDRQQAKKAYDTVRNMMSRVTFSEEETAVVRKRLDSLRTDLEHLGEPF